MRAVVCAERLEDCGGVQSRAFRMSESTALQGLARTRQVTCAGCGALSDPTHRHVRRWCKLVVRQLLSAST